MPKTAEQPPEPRTSLTVAAEITAQADARRAAASEFDRLTAARPAMLLDPSAKGDAALDAHDIAIGRQRRVIERSDAVVAVLEVELAQIQADEDQVARIALYAEGQVAASEVADLVLNDYPSAARAVVDVLRRIDAAKVVVAQANAALPAGARAIDAEEFRANRGAYYQPPGPLAASVSLPGARASDGTLWPLAPAAVAPFNPHEERARRQRGRDAGPARLDGFTPTPVARYADPDDRPGPRVIRGDEETWLREREARERQGRSTTAA